MATINIDTIVTGSKYYSVPSGTIDLQREYLGANAVIQVWDPANNAAFKVDGNFKKLDTLTLKITYSEAGFRDKRVCRLVSAGLLYLPDGTRIAGTTPLEFTQPCTLTLFFYTNKHAMLHINK